jgi:hypothetical protein
LSITTNDSIIKLIIFTDFYAILCYHSSALMSKPAGEIHLFNYSIDQSIHMMENASVWWRRTPYIHCIHLFDRLISDLLISFIKRRFLANRTSVWRRRRFSCARGRVAAVAEGGGGRCSSGEGGDQRSRERRRLR